MHSGLEAREGLGHLESVRAPEGRLPGVTNTSHCDERVCPESQVDQLQSMNVVLPETQTTRELKESSCRSVVEGPVGPGDKGFSSGLTFAREYSGIQPVIRSSSCREPSRSSP